MANTKLRNSSVILFLAICHYSCSPVIRSFTVQPLTITSEDSVKVNWDVRGKPTLLVHENIVPPDPANLGPSDAGKKFLELTLVVQKRSKEQRRIVQVAVLPKLSTDEIVFRTDLRGDTLVAAGDKNSERWGDKFEIASVSSGSGRQLFVWHANKTVVLDKNGAPSNALMGTPVAGRWEIRSLLTDAEKKDMSTAPETLRLNATIQSKRN